MWRGGQAGGWIWRHTLAQLREPIVSLGLDAADDVDAALALVESERFSSVSPLVMAVWGRRP